MTTHQVNGRLIVFEGIDGVGKTTQLERLARRLEAAGLAPRCTREPYDCPAGRRIRARAREALPPPPETELAWFVEQRRDHVREVIAPALARGELLLCDRYYFSSVAYQGARGLDWRRILAEHEAGKDFPRPALALLLDLDPARALGRIKTRAAAAEPAFEEATYLERVRQIYLEVATEQDVLLRIDASGSAAAVAARIEHALQRRLGLPE